MESIRKQLKGSSDKGFTLIELLVVVLILGILSVIAVVAVNNARTTAISKACKASAVTVINALDQYNIDKQGYPTATGAAVSGAAVAGTKAYTTGVSSDLNVLVPNYLKKLPDLGVSAPTGSDYALNVVLAPAANGNVATLAVTGYDASGSAIDGCVAP